MREIDGIRRNLIRANAGRGQAPARPFRPRTAAFAASLLIGLSIGAPAGAQGVPVEKVIWVRGENYLVEPRGDSLPDGVLESSAEGRSWSRSETSVQERKGKKMLTATPHGSPGKLNLRLRDAKTGRIARRMEVTVLPEAGSPETGPYLQLLGAWDGELIREQAGARTKIPRNRGFMNAAFRLSKAKGGESLENSYDRMNRSMLDTLRAYASTRNVVPVAICRVFFHYVHDDLSQAKRGEYARVSLGSDTSETNIVTFMARPAFTLANMPDPVTSIDISGDGFSLTLPPDGQAEAVIRGSGPKRIRFVVHGASGRKMRSESQLFVKRELSPDETRRRDENLARNFDVVRPDMTFSEGADR